MKKKSNRPTIGVIANDGNPAPTVFDQLLVINCAMSRELGIDQADHMAPGQEGATPLLHGVRARQLRHQLIGNKVAELPEERELCPRWLAPCLFFHTPPCGRDQTRKPTPFQTSTNKPVGLVCELFMDEQASFCGDRGRTDIHLNLLACMLDVEKIRRTLPPTTRSQYYDNLTKVFKLTPKAYDWFSDVCDDIKFPLNNLGRKRQSPAASL